MNKNWDFPKALLFDLDGVLIDSEPLHGKAWEETAAQFDLNLTYGQIKLLRGRRRIDCAQEIIKLAPKPVDIDELLKVHKPISKRLMLSAKAMPGSEGLVRWCHANNLPIALVTSSSYESLQVKKSPHNWINLFSITVLGDDKLLNKGKPAPDPYLLAAQKLNVEPKECWVVEDSISGVTSAVNAECNVFFLKEKGDKRKYNFSNADKNLREIEHLNVVEEILNGYQS